MRPIKTILMLLLLAIGNKAFSQTDSLSTSIFVGYPDRIKTLDSLIQNAKTLALTTNDYQDAYTKALNAGVNADFLLLKVANQFFKNLAYGNKAPKLEFEGAHYNPGVYNVSSLVTEYANNNNLAGLVNYFTQSSKEVATILDTLNFYQNAEKPNTAKIQLLYKAANDYRWLSAIRQNNRIIIVNIPSAQLNAYDSNKLAMSMRVVLGRPGTKTTTLSSDVKKVVLNPYWHVPGSIIRNEMIPKFKNDKAYFAKNNYTILNAQDKVVDVSTIDVNTITAGNFPYTVRQGSGASNSLGLLKVEFDSPSAIYLHDSPQKSLFKNASRFYSHGCVRMEKPIDMGKWLLVNNSKEIDNFDFKKPGKYKGPKPQKVVVPTKVIIWYSLVDFDNNGQLKFYKNIYNKK
jgi:lipoprotein-anchoring transpeptidase ErfK/SrfK